ncbi:MAG: glycine cleavage system protein GcvH [Clostridia bacterium]|nr:glycine cleavage system protein H [Bacillota bacterium]MBO2521154.1 glycine cleavage system protein H [Bacillota bacterium]
MYPEELKYTKEHEWLRLEDGRLARVGVTHYAQHQLGDVVFVELPAAGDAVSAGQSIAVVESVKSVSDIYAPVSGRIVEVNSALEDQPELINEDPYGRGWIAVIEMDDPGQADGLLTAAEYKAHIGEA